MGVDNPVGRSEEEQNIGRLAWLPPQHLADGHGAKTTSVEAEEGESRRSGKQGVMEGKGQVEEKMMKRLGDINVARVIGGTRHHMGPSHDTGIWTLSGD